MAKKKATKAARKTTKVAKRKTAKRRGRPPKTPAQKKADRDREAAEKRERRAELKRMARTAKKNAGLPVGSDKKEGHPGLPFEPKPAQRAQVEMMAGLGIKHEEICILVENEETGEPIDVKTLQKHFAAELARGPVIANSRVGQSLYQKAIGDGNQAVTAAIFWSKVRMGWKERIDVNVETKSGVLLTPQGMTPEDWIKAAQARAEGAKEPGSDDST